MEPLLLYPLVATFDAVPSPFALVVVLNLFHEASDEVAIFEGL